MNFMKRHLGCTRRESVGTNVHGSPVYYSEEVPPSYGETTKAEPELKRDAKVVPLSDSCLLHQKTVKYLLEVFEKTANIDVLSLREAKKETRKLQQISPSLSYSGSETDVWRRCAHDYLVCLIELCNPEYSDFIDTFEKRETDVRADLLDRIFYCCDRGNVGENNQLFQKLNLAEMTPLPFYQNYYSSCKNRLKSAGYEYHHLYMLIAIGVAITEISFDTEKGKKLTYRKEKHQSVMQSSNVNDRLNHIFSKPSHEARVKYILNTFFVCT
jgi:hypothetical protein